MWQRIQTVFLALTALFMIATIFFPIWKGAEEDGVARILYPLHYTIDEGNGPLVNYFPYSLTAILAVASATLSMISVTRYKNRLLQMKLGAFNSLIMAGVIISAVYFSNKFVNEFGQGYQGLGLYLPMGGVICNLVANRFIRRDEKLVRDSERIR